MYDAPQVFPDGAVLPAETTLEALRAGEYNAVPVVFGTNRDENKLFQFLDPKRVRRLFWILPMARDAVSYHRDADYGARSWKLAGVDGPARALAAHQPGRVFAYRWDWDEEPKVLWSDLGKLLGAAHGLEIAFVFDHWGGSATTRALYTEENAAGREALSAAMQSYWAAYARGGDPGRGAKGELPLWSAWSEAGDKYIVLDTPEGGGIRMSGETESVADLVAAIEADSTYADAAERCTQLAFVHRNAPDAFDFAASAGGSCGAFSPAALLAAAR
jgi:para-nitrobenzyl esterase